jgi:predicted transposase YdaD
LRQKHELPVLPIAVYLNVGLNGLGLDEYREHYGPLPVLHFQYLYVGLPRLDAVEYVQRGLPLGAALVSLMKVPTDRRAWLNAEARQRIAAAGLNEYLTFLLMECLEAYLNLTPDEMAEVERLLQQDDYREARQMAVTTFERGVQQGELKGRQEGRQEGRLEGFELGLRRAISVQLRTRFAAVPDSVLARLDRMTGRELEELLEQLAGATSLAELGLAEEA